MKPRGERAVPRKRGSPRRRHCPVLVCAWIFPATCICLASCASHRDHVGSVREAYFAGNLVDADRHIEKQLKQHKHEADAFLLDKAMLELAAGRPKNSERILRGVRDRFDHLEEKDAGEFTISMLTDDTRRAYAGEDYEKVLIRIMLSLSNVMSGGGDAGAYALQVVEKQQQIIASVTEKSRPEEADQPRMELAYKQLALGPYIRAMLAEESPLTQDEVTTFVMRKPICRERNFQNLSQKAMGHYTFLHSLDAVLSNRSTKKFRLRRHCLSPIVF